MASDTLLEQRIQQIAVTHGIPLDTVRTALAEFIEALHELEFKHTKPPALLQVYFSLGDKAAWHYMGFGMELLDAHYIYVDDARRDRLESAQRLDSRMARFSPILDGWKKESQD